MQLKYVLSVCLVVCWAAMALADDTKTGESKGAGDSGPKMVGGMSIVGNDEAPKSLFIVPWKSSELGVETSLSRTLDQRDEPVDRDVFQRELEFYQVSVGR
ncbi:hypothetical protein [Geotalea sp. SG265]|uniref:hypothetical protein n=1 Tax=Geotalea sp. SG265 TaxID=2922867 RepID=UPI001FAE9491|nr:hypothetical protein [Geotalea sp. SG265]